MMKRTIQSGFTLVEIAMVFVVIALIMGGILKTSEMVTNARLKKIQSTHVGLVAARDLYYDRYRNFPGDDSNATDHFTAYLGLPAMNGNGDGEVGDGDDWNLDESVSLTDGGQETLKFFAHLRAAGYIEGSSMDYRRPHHSLDYGEIGIQSGSLGLRKNVIVFADIDGDYIRILDTWHDDDDLTTGTIRATAVADGMDFSDDPASVIVPEDQYHLVWEMAGH
jgi:type II secretory pathway pseudopilin PulG